MKEQLKVILLQWLYKPSQFIPMILMIVDITSKVDDSTKTAAYADDVNASGKIIQLKNW